MKKFRTLLLVSITLLSLMPAKVKASHCAGAELIYSWVSDSTYRIYYKFYRDCFGIPEGDSVQLCIKSTCDAGYPNSGYSINIGKVPGTLPTGVPNGSEVQKQCPGVNTTCTSTGASVPGYREWWYSGLVTLDFRCNYWEFSVTQSARNAAITNLATLGNLWVDATLDNLDFQGDTSPYFSVKPVPYVCDNAPYSYNNGAVDINNDSMYFQLEYPSGSGACEDTFGANIDTFNQAGIPGPGGAYIYNLFNNPLQCNNTFSLNHRNGQLSFTPSGVQIAVVNLLVKSYRSGVLIGHVMRDIQVVVRECPNQQPVVNVNTTTITGGVIDNNGNITTCAGNHFNFVFLASSADTSAKLVVEDNHNAAAPGSLITYTNYYSDTVTGVFDWTPSATDTGYKVLTITVSDSSCRPPGIILKQTFTLPMFILPQTHAFHDTSICDGDTVHLFAVGGGNFVWTAPDGSGPSSILTCSSCPNPVVSPHVTTDYVVTSDLTSICKNVDTAHIAVTPALIVTVSPDTTTCVHDSVQLFANVTTPPGVTYTSVWQPAATVSNPLSLTPFVKPSVTTAYFITVVPIGGLGQCTKIDTIHVNVLQGFTLFNHDTAMCVGDSLTVNLSGTSQYTYTWTPAVGISVADIHSRTPLIKPDTSRLYTVTASYPGCSDSVASFFVDMQPYPIVDAGPDRIICTGDTAHLRGSVSPKNRVYTYTWAPGGAVDSPSHIHAIFSALVTTGMTLNVSTTAGCTGSDNLTVTVVKNNFLHISPDTTICPHAVVQIHITGDSLMYFNWKKNEYIGDVTNADPFVFPVTTTSFTVYGVDSTLCRDTATVFVYIKPGASISLPDTITLYPGDTYQMNPLTNCNNFSWSPALGLDTTNISNPTANPAVSTRYFVTGITEGGCIVSDTIQIIRVPDSYINIANAFAPGHGPNAVLKVLHLGTATLKSFIIYNRWGVKLFESHDVNQGWDGTYNGQPQPMGVYIYSVEATSYEGVGFNKHGNVTLLR